MITYFKVRGMNTQNAEKIILSCHEIKHDVALNRSTHFSQTGLRGNSIVTIFSKPYMWQWPNTEVLHPESRRMDRLCK